MSDTATGDAGKSRDAILRDIAAKLPVKPDTRKRRHLDRVHGDRRRGVRVPVPAEPDARVGRVRDQHALLARHRAGRGRARVRDPARRTGAGAGRSCASPSRCRRICPYGIATMIVLLVGGIWTYLPWTKHVEPRQARVSQRAVPVRAHSVAGLGLLWWLTP